MSVGGKTVAVEHVEQFLQNTYVAVLVTLRGDGRPHAVPVWYLYEDGVFYVVTEPSTRKARNLLRDRRVSLCVASHDMPYRYVVAEGEAELETGDTPEGAAAAHQLLWKMAVRYMGREAGERYAGSVAGDELVVIRLAPARLLTYDEGGA